MPCSFLSQFQSSHKSSWATPARGKMHYLSRCQRAVLLGGSSGGHTCEGFPFPQRSKSFLDLLHPCASLCPAMPAGQRGGWCFSSRSCSPQSSQQSWCHVLSQGPPFGQPFPRAPQAWALLLHQSMVRQKIKSLIHT